MSQLQQEERAQATTVAWRWKKCLGCDTTVAVPDVVTRYWCENCVWEIGDHVTVIFKRGDGIEAVTGYLLSEYVAHETGVHLRGSDGRIRLVTPSLVVSVNAAAPEGGGF